MSIPISDFSKLIPQDIKNKIRDTVVDFLSESANTIGLEKASKKIKGLRTDAAFTNAFEEAIDRALTNFYNKYETEDEDMVELIRRDTSFLKDEEVMSTLKALLRQPHEFNERDIDPLIGVFSGIFPNRKGRQRVVRAVLLFLHCLAEEVWSIPELNAIYNVHYQRVAMKIAQQQLEYQKAQLLEFSRLRRELIEALIMFMDKSFILRYKQQDALPSISEIPKILHNLPQPDYEEFIGRDIEIDEIKRILHPDSRNFIVAISGIGGIGKSALAVEIAYRYLNNLDDFSENELFDAIIWSSAKRRSLHTYEIVEKGNPSQTLGDIFTCIAITLQDEKITQKKGKEQEEKIRQALIINNRRVLLIIDNFETISDESVLEFVWELPAPTKAIITSRNKIGVPHEIELHGMEFTDAQNLIRQECRRKQLDLTDLEIETLYKRTAGVPLALVWTIGLIAAGQKPESVFRQLSEPTSDIAEFIFSGSVSLLEKKHTLAYSLLEGKTLGMQGSV